MELSLSFLLKDTPQDAIFQWKVTIRVLFLSKWYLKGRGVVCRGGATLFKFLLTKYPLGAGGKTF